MSFSVSSLAVLWPLKWNLQCFRESMPIEISLLSQLMLSLFCFIWTIQTEKKANFTLLFFFFLVVFSINYASYCLRRNGKLYKNAAQHFIIIILFTYIRGFYILGATFQFFRKRITAQKWR